MLLQYLHSPQLSLLFGGSFTAEKRASVCPAQCIAKQADAGLFRAVILHKEIVRAQQFPQGKGIQAQQRLPEPLGVVWRFHMGLHRVAFYHVDTGLVATAVPFLLLGHAVFGAALVFLIGASQLGHVGVAVAVGVFSGFNLRQQRLTLIGGKMAAVAFGGSFWFGVRVFGWYRGGRHFFRLPRHDEAHGRFLASNRGKGAGDGVQQPIL